MPRAVADRMRELSPAKGGIVKRVTSIPMLYDIEARIRMIDQWPGYQQVLTIANPPPEAMAGAGESPELARVANDAPTKTCDRRPGECPAWVGPLPANNVVAYLAGV